MNGDKKIPDCADWNRLRLAIRERLKAEMAAGVEDLFRRAACPRAAEETEKAIQQIADDAVLGYLKKLLDRKIVHIDRSLLSETPAGETLEKIREDLGDCRRCDLWRTRKNLVFGEGNPKADIMFVGEAPGADEDDQGRPFVGRAGKLLDKMIRAMGFERGDVYIANVLKSRPPENREPMPNEVAACGPFLRRQIAAIRPKVIVALGLPACRFLTGRIESMSAMRGRIFIYEGIPLVPTYHPAYLLRNPGAKGQSWEDLKVAIAILRVGIGVT